MATEHALINNSYSDEWYTPAYVVRTMLKVFPPNAGDRILLPFDTAESNFTKIITAEYDKQAIWGIQDFLTRDYEFDYLISNPPYSIKDKIIERCIDLGKPSVLLLPIDTLGGVQRHKLFHRTRIGVYIPTKRIKFINENGDNSKTPAYHNIVMLINANKNSIHFEYEYKETEK